MPLTFSDVRTLEGALRTGIMRSTYWLFHQLNTERERNMFLQQRFPSLSFGQISAIRERMRQSYEQGLVASGDPSTLRLGQLQSDPSHTAQGRIAYNVEVTAAATGGELDEFGRPGVRVRFITIYSEGLLSEAQLQAEIRRSAEETFRDEYGRELARGEVTMTGLDYSIINVTRSF